MLFWQKNPAFGFASKDLDILSDAKQFRMQLLALISRAKTRIYITALYLQDDEAGREVLEALHKASIAKPELEVIVLVDFHRAQRGLIGAAKSDGNSGLYCQYHEKYQSNVQIYGVPVKSRELLGVLHFKGFVIDDMLVYSGASLNNIYLHHNEQYRLDRYFFITQGGMCDAVVNLIKQHLLSCDAVPRIDVRPIPQLNHIKVALKQCMGALKRASYDHAEKNNGQPVGARLFLGLGRRSNKLNRVIKSLFDTTEQELVLYTPYFNFPKPLMRSLKHLLKQGRQVIIVVGDKTANDFYAPPTEPFSKIGVLPYLYEIILRKFLKSQQQHMLSGKLHVFLWRHNSNSFHLKGICSDRKYHLLSGHNLNPRAWGLDLENGVLLEDLTQCLIPAIDRERTAILKHCRRLEGYKDVDTMNDYPPEVQKLLRRAKRIRLDAIIKRFI